MTMLSPTAPSAFFNGDMQFDPAAGGARWRRAVRKFEAAAQAMAGRHGAYDPTDKVVSLAVAREHSPSVRASRERCAEALKTAAMQLISVDAPNPRELANKLVLLAWLHGMADPRGSYTSDPDPENLSDALGRLFIQACVLDQYHRPPKRPRAREAR